MIKRLLINPVTALQVTCLSLFLCLVVQAQSNPQEARKFDEFGDIQISDLKARLDNFAIQLQQSPGTRGFVIVYRSHRDLPGLSSRLLAPIRDYMINSRGIPSDRLVTIDGGEASAITYEFWIIPVGKTPTPRSDAYSRHLIVVESALKFDEYYYYMPQDSEDGVDYSGSSLEAFADALRMNPRAQAYILVYPQYYRGRIDPPKTASKMIGKIKAALINNYHLALPRIKLVNGGYRKRRQVELWIVPRGEHPPIATPNAFPKRHK